MVRGQCLSQEEYRQDGAEDRHKMDKGPCCIGPEHCHSTVPEDEGQYRGKDGYIQNSNNGSTGDGHDLAPEKLHKIKRKQDCKADQDNPRQVC